MLLCWPSALTELGKYILTQVFYFELLISQRNWEHNYLVSPSFCWEPPSRLCKPSWQLLNWSESWTALLYEMSRLDDCSYPYGKRRLDLWQRECLQRRRPEIEELCKLWMFLCICVLYQWGHNKCYLLLVQWLARHSKGAKSWLHCSKPRKGYCL